MNIKRVNELMDKLMAIHRLSFNTKSEHHVRVKMSDLRAVINALADEQASTAVKCSEDFHKGMEKLRSEQLDSKDS